MKNKNIINRSICLVLSLALVLSFSSRVISLAAEMTKSPSTPVEAAQGDHEKPILKKDETVYVNLNPNGSVREQIVTDKIHSDTVGIIVEDKSDLENIEVIKGGELIKNEGGNLTWQLSAKDLYYRGKGNKTLPFDVSIKYFLDGKEQAPEKLVGKSGVLQIKVDFKNNLMAKRMIKGTPTEIYSPMALAAAFMFPTDKFEKVEASDCTVATEGDNTTVAIACMPGLYKSLNLENSAIEELRDLKFPESFTIKANVTNFEMSNIALTGKLGFPEDEVDTAFIDDMESDMKDAQRMKNSFESMDSDRALREMLTDDKKISQITKLLDDMDELLDLNKDLIDRLPKYVTKENVDILDRIITEMDDIDLRYLKDFHYAENNSEKKNINMETGQGVKAALDFVDILNLDNLALLTQDMKTIKDPKVQGLIQYEAENISDPAIMAAAFAKADPEVQMLVMMLLNPTGNKQIGMMGAKLKNDFAANSENLEAAMAVGEHPKDAYLRKFLNESQNIYDDFLALYPTIALMQGDLRKENLRESFREAPKTVDSLINIKNDIEENKEVTDNLRKITEKENVEKIKDIITTLDDFERDKVIEDYTAKIDNLQDLIVRKDLLKAMAEENKIYTDYADGMDGDYLMVLKTDEIKAPKIDDKKADIPPKKSPVKGFIDKILNK